MVLRFEYVVPEAPPSVDRADIACFVGFVRRRPGALPASIEARLASGPYGRGPDAVSTAQREALFQIPVPIDSWEAFDRVFEWERDGGTSIASYLGAAVRSFFAQGGRRCWVVRAGDPIALDAPRDERLRATRELLPNASDVTPHDRSTFAGAAFLIDLEEVSFLALPDLPELFRDVLEPRELPEPEVVRSDRFIDCGETTFEVAAQRSLPRVGAPMCHEVDSYVEWGREVGRVANFLDRYRKDVQLIAAVPLPAEDSAMAADLLEPLIAAGAFDARPRGVCSAFVQLVFPWVGTEHGAFLPGSLEPPDGVLVGLLARNALESGTYAPASLSDVYGVRRYYPELSAAQRTRPRPIALADRGTNRVLGLEQRVSILGNAPDGPVLLTDVTTSLDPAYRPASVNRLFSVWVRSARAVGQDLVFEPSGEDLWDEVRARMESVGRALFDEGALKGLQERDAFQVRCDRTTMTSNDLDHGRLVANVTFQPAVPVERITVAMSIREGGPV